MPYESRRPLGRLLAFCIFPLLLLALTPTAAMAQDDVVIQIKRLFTTGLESYDFFEYDKAEASFQEAIDLAKEHEVRDPIVARIYLHRGILFHAKYKDSAPAIARDKASDEFAAAVLFDYNIKLDENYATDELSELLEKARETVPPPTDVGGGTGGNGGTGSAGDPVIKHDPMTVADAGMPVMVQAMVPAHAEVFRVRAHYRPGDSPAYEVVELQPSSSNPDLFQAEIPAAATASATIDYYIEALNRTQEQVASAGSRSQPFQMTVIGDYEPPSGGDGPIFNFFVAAGTGFGLANGDSLNCAQSIKCVGDGNGDGVPDSENYGGVAPGLAPAPFHINTELSFWLIPDLQLSLYGRIQIVELGFMIGAKLRYFALNEEPHRFYTGLGVGYGSANFVVDLGAAFNNFRDIVPAEGPAHLGFNLGYMLSFHENVGIQFDLYVPIHFPEFTFHADISVGPYFQF